MKLKIKHKIFIFLILLYMTIFANGTKSFFAEFDIGSINNATGNAISLFNTDGSLLHYNPASLNKIEQPQLYFDYSYPMVHSTFLSYLSYLYPTTKYGNFGIGIIHFKNDNIRLTDEYNNQYGVTSQTLREYKIAYGRTIYGSLSGGLGFNYFTENFYSSSAGGFGIDAGLYYLSAHQYIKNLKNLKQKVLDNISALTIKQTEIMQSGKLKKMDLIKAIIENPYNEDLISNLKNVKATKIDKDEYKIIIDEHKSQAEAGLSSGHISKGLVHLRILMSLLGESDYILKLKEKYKMNVETEIAKTEYGIVLDSYYQTALQLYSKNEIFESYELIQLIEENLIYNKLLNRIESTIIIKNLYNTGLDLFDVNEPFPMKLSIGLKYKVLDNLNSFFAYNRYFSDISDNNIINIGLRYNLFDKYYIQTGLEWKSSVTVPGIGFGYQYRMFYFDYGLSYRKDFGLYHKLSVRMDFGKTFTETGNDLLREAIFYKNYKNLRKALNCSQTALNYLPENKFIEKFIRRTERELNDATKSLVAKVKRSYSKKQYSATQRYLKKLEKADYESPVYIKYNKKIHDIAEAYYQRGQKNYNINKYDNALTDFQHAYNLFKTNKKYEKHYELAKKNLSSAQQQNLINKYTTLISKYENNLQYDKAIKYAESILEIDPANEYASGKRDQLIQTRQKNEKALNLYSNAKKTSDIFTRYNLLFEARNNNPADKNITNAYIKAKQELDKKGNDIINNAENYISSNNILKARDILKSFVSKYNENTAVNRKLRDINNRLSQKLEMNIDIITEKIKNKEYNIALDYLKESKLISPDDNRIKKYYKKVQKILEKKINDYYKKGLKHLDKEDYNNARSYFQKILHIKPDDKEIQAKIKLCEQKIEGQKLKQDILSMYADALDDFRGRQFDSAEKKFKKILELEPDNKMTKEKLEELKMKLVEESKSQEVREKTNEARKLLKQKKYYQAIQLFEEAYKLDPSRKVIKNAYIIPAQRKYNKYKESRLAKAEKLKDIIEAYKIVSDLYKDNSADKNIASAYNKIKKEFDKHLDDIFIDVKAQIVLKEYKQAFNSIRKFDDFLETRKEYKKIYNELKNKVAVIEVADTLYAEGTALLDQNNKSEALKKFENILKLMPDYDKAKTKIDEITNIPDEEIQEIIKEGKKLYSKQNYFKAFRKFRVALVRYPTNDEILKYIDNCKNKIEPLIKQRQQEIKKMYNNYKYDRVIELAEMLLDHDPTLKDVRSLLSKAKRKKEERIRKQKEENEKRIAKYLDEGVLLYRNQELEEAIEKWKKILEIDKDNVDAKRYIKRARETLERFSD